MVGNKEFRIHNYPSPNLRFIRGKWVVEVSIPSSIRFLFGSGAVRARRKSTKTTDRALAEARMSELALVIYKEFDDVQKDYADKGDQETEEFAVDIIYELASLFKYNRGVVPTLDPSTDYQALLSMKGTFDGYVKLVQDEMHSLSLEKGVNEVIPSPDELKLIREALTTGVVAEELEVILARQRKRTEESHMFTSTQIGLLHRYNSTVVQNFFQDLLTEAAQQQDKIAPVFEERQNAIDVEVINSITLPKGSVNGAKLLQRDRKTVANGTLKVSDFTEAYLEAIERDYDKADTRNKLRRGVNKFRDLMGDPPIQEIKKVTAYTFIDKQLEITPNASNRLIKDTNWALSKFFSFLMKKGYVELNPFLNLDLKNYGTPKKSYLPYSQEELFTIFNYKWKPQERLLLSIMITTGMRLNEAGSLTWERYNDTEFQGIRCFSLLDTEEEMVAVKNKGSNRIVPIHPDLVLPERGAGRIFDYKIYADNTCATSAGRAVNSTLQMLVPHKNKSAHSFRGTLKILLRDAGVSKELNDYYTGHSLGDASGKAYGGVSVLRRYEEISKVRHPWLKSIKS